MPMATPPAAPGLQPCACATGCKPWLPPDPLPSDPLLHGDRPCNWLVRNRWDTLSEVSRLTALPLLFLSSLEVTFASRRRCTAAGW